MGNITIREILAADTVSDLVDKVNFNFDQLLLNGGGPQGPIGIQGGIGPIGPRGVIWFTCYDIFNTNATLTGVPGLFFPTWDPLIGPERVNNPLITGFPQFAGDPNRYLPAATLVAPNTYPQYSFIIGTIGKMVKSGDLYLQETDDTFNLYQSFDGDVWEFSAVLNTWIFTGVNIKGDKGDTGVAGATDWVRTTDTTSSPFIDLLRPVVDTGNDTIVRILLGKDDPLVVTELASQYTKNLLTLYQDDVNLSTAGGSQLAFTGTGSPEVPILTSDTSDYANIGTRSNTFNITGFNAATTGYPVNIIARSGNVVLSATDPVTATNTATLDSSYREFKLNNAQLHVYCSPSIAPVGRVTHRFSDGEIALNIIHNQSSTYGPWLSGKSIRMYTEDPNAPFLTTYLVLQEDPHNRLGVGGFDVLPPNAKVSIISDFQFPAVAALSAGTTWGSVINLSEVDSQFLGLSNTAFIQSHIVIGAEATPTKFGNESYNSASLLSSVNIKKGFIGFNTFINNTDTAGALKSMDGYSGQGNFFIGPGKSLTVNGSISSAFPDNDGKFIIGSSSSLLTTVNTQYTGSKYGSQQFNVNLSIDPALAQVGINTLNLQADFNSLGGAMIGKFKRYANDPIFGHEDLQINHNIILGYPLGSSTTNPRIVNTAGVAFWPTAKNSVLINAPTWSSSLNFDSTTTFQRATNQSWASRQLSALTSGPLRNYLPSLNSQFKIVHGRTLAAGITQLGDANLHNIGLGLEIETRTNFVPPPSLGSNFTTPVVRDKSGIAIESNRSMLVSKRYMPGTGDGLVLFEIGQTGNTSIGESIRYPRFVVSDLYYNGGITSAVDLNNTNIVIEDGSTVQLSSDDNYSKTWELGVNQSFITPKFNRSLHISSIGDTTYAKSEYQHQKSGYIPAGIIFNADNIVTGDFVSINALFRNYNSKLQTGFSYNGYEHQIISSVNYHGVDNGGNILKSAEPLGIKPGPLVNRYDSVLPGASVLKAKDLILSGGDLAYNIKATKMRAGDVYIHGGTVFRNQINPTGLAFGLQDIGGSPSANPVQEYANYGHIFLGSKNNDQITSIFNEVTKAGNVYVGYQSNLKAGVVSQVWNDSNVNWSPKGDASLNVSTAVFTGLRDAAPLVQANGKAINIQLGDIVTYNQPAGWQTVNLLTTGYIDATTTNLGIFGASVQGKYSNVFSAIYGNGARQQAAYTQQSTTGGGIPQVFPSWTFSYKVIGYTVFWNLNCQSILWKSQPAAGVTGDGQAIYMDMDILNQFSKVPLPFNSTVNTPVVYNSGQTPAENYSYKVRYNLRNNLTFNGSGLVILRNNRNGTRRFPVQNKNQNDVILTSNIVARHFVEAGVNYMEITKPGPWSFALNADLFNFEGPSTGVTDPYRMRDLMSAHQGIVPFQGYSVADATGNANNSTELFDAEIQLDFMVSGTYEIDPTTFFNY
jgi:hypothetical protein